MNTQPSAANRTIAAALYVWTQTLQREGASVEQRLEQVVGEVAAAGYEAVELSLILLASPENRTRIRESLQANGLAATSFYSGGPFHDEAAFERYQAETLPLARHAAELGAPALCVNPAVKREGKRDAELQTQVRNLDRFGEALRGLGMELWLHNHDPEMRDDARELRASLDETRPEWVRYCADVHWIYRGGGDPYAYLERYGPRLGSLHVRNSRGGIWSEEFGDGDIDYRRVRRILDAQAFTGPVIVELAIEKGTPHTRPLVESARLSREYAAAVLAR